MNHEPTNLNDLAALARTTKSTRYRRALSDATSEIERLRAEASELRGWKVDALKTYQVCAMERERLRDKVGRLEALPAHLEREIQRLIAERDEARRKICKIESECICDPPRSPQKYASLFGWDCFKEDTR